MKYLFIADAVFSGISYSTGKEYELTPIEYANLKMSCTPAQNKKPDNKGLTTTNLIKDNDKTVDTILIIKSYGIGNIVMSTPIINGMNRIYPDAKIDLLVDKEYYKSVLKGHKLINKIYSWESDKEKILNNRYDLVFDGLPSDFQKTEISCKKRIIGDNNTVKTNHEVQSNLDMLKQLSGKVLDRSTDMIIKKPEKIIEGDYITICAGYADIIYWAKKKLGI